MKIIKFTVLCLLIFAQTLYAKSTQIHLKDEKCANDYYNSVSSLKNECIRLLSKDEKQQQADELVIYLHGDYYVGGVDYLKDVSAHFSKAKRMNFALVRPGYYDAQGNFSTGNALGITSTKVAGVLDNYTKENIDIIADGILNLKKHYHAKRVLLVGHSGGGAIASLLLNFYPQLIDGALLINCPCDLKHWRPDWEKSLSPIEHIDNISKKALIHVLAGSDDDIVAPMLSKNYAQQLTKNQFKVKFYFGLNMKHSLDDATTRETVIESIGSFLEQTQSQK